MKKYDETILNGREQNAIAEIDLLVSEARAARDFSAVVSLIEQKTRLLTMIHENNNTSLGWSAGGY